MGKPYTPGAPRHGAGLLREYPHGRQPDCAAGHTDSASHLIWHLTPPELAEGEIGRLHGGAALAPADAHANVGRLWGSDDEWLLVVHLLPGVPSRPS